jgi:putative aldouronate transport system permease protein
MAFAWLACEHFSWIEKTPYELGWGFWAYIALSLLSIILAFVSAGLSRLKVHSGEFKDHLALLTMLIPGSIFLLVFAYLPMPGVLLAFKNYKLQGTSLFESFFKSAWVGLNNFRFIFQTPDAYNMTKNTVVYNLIFIVLGLIASVLIAIGITEISNRRTAKVYQTLYFLPYFLSWVAVSYLVYALLNYEYGVLNSVLKFLSLPSVDWYMESKYWPMFFVIANLWKYAGNGSIIYMATIVGMDSGLFEAASIDGANRFKQIWHITLPLLRPTMILLTILAMGRIFYADFGLFYLLTRGMGQLRNVSMVIDVYVYGSLSRGTINIGMTAAVALYQSAVGFVLVLLTNWIVSKISPENTLL